MINVSEDIDSLTHFKRETAKFLQQLRKTGRPVVLTVNGKAQLVVQDAESYQKLLDLVDWFGTIEAIQEGLEEMKAGKGRPAEEVFERIRKKHRIARDA